LEKISNEAFASLPEMLFSFRIMACILDVERYPGLTGESIIKFINSGWFLEGMPPIEEILRLTENYINEKSHEID
jgi:hypothetical protein